MKVKKDSYCTIKYNRVCFSIMVSPILYFYSCYIFFFYFIKSIIILYLREIKAKIGKNKIILK